MSLFTNRIKFKKDDNKQDQEQSNQPENTPTNPGMAARQKKQDQYDRPKYNRSMGIQQQKSDYYLKYKVSGLVEEDIENIKRIVGESYDFSSNTFNLENKEQKIKVGILFFAGLVDQTFVSERISELLIKNFKNSNVILKSSKETLDYFKNNLLTMAGVTTSETYDKLINLLLNGDTILLVENVKSCFIISSRKMIERGVEQPTTNVTVKGSKVAFNENLLTNISLIRRIIRHPSLWAKNYVIGDMSNTNVTLMYIKGVASETLIDEVTSRIEAIKANNVLGTTHIRYYLKEKQVSIFPILYESERPDEVAGGLFEGRIAILIDGSPYVIIAPNVLLHSIHSVEDFYQKAYIASFFRILRIIAFFISIFLPGLYLAVVLHHAEILPFSLLISIAAQRGQVPFPVVVEIFIMTLAFDLLREAGARMPTALGGTLSFVGAIIIGSVAVEAGLISSIIIIIVTTSAIGSLAIPDYDLNLTITVSRYFFLILSALLGFLGIGVGITIYFGHLISLRSFGVPYLSPIVPFNKEGLKDSLIRLPLKNIQEDSRNINEKYPE